jgi:hypothetical protein
VTEDGPAGVCKLHKISQFTKAEYLWSYSARYEVLNKPGADGVYKCDEIREQEAIYIPGQKQETGWTDCETIQFDPGCYSPDFPCLGSPAMVVE